MCAETMLYRQEKKKKRKEIFVLGTNKKSEFLFFSFGQKKNIFFFGTFFFFAVGPIFFFAVDSFFFFLFFCVPFFRQSSFFFFRLFMIRILPPPKGCCLMYSSVKGKFVTSNLERAVDELHNVHFVVSIRSQRKEMFGLPQEPQILLVPGQACWAQQHQKLQTIVAHMQQPHNKKLSLVIDLTMEPADTHHIFSEEGGYSLLGTGHFNEHTILSCVKSMYRQRRQQRECPPNSNPLRVVILTV